ncbi:MAG: glycosyltransferase family 2 protein [bacterium]|nr:glycosyltransferase family 2 protein [bacterium]
MMSESSPNVPSNEAAPVPPIRQEHGDVRPAPSRRYCLITPCRNEAEYIRSTLETTTQQSVPPTLWVIVDDGSTDETPEILAEYAARFDYIQIVSRADRGARAVGPGVVEAFYDGLSHVDLADFDYVCKFDGDLEIPPRYFERLMEIMEEDPYMGNCSGKLHLRHDDGTLEQERTGDENAVGPTKFYRVECFEDIGGFVREVSWDGIDGHICRMKGWIAQSRDEELLRVIHLRQMGSSQHSLWVGRVRWGRGKYFMGSAWYYVAAVALYRMFERPWVLGGLGIAWGYLKASIQRHPRYENPAYRRYLRRYEASSLFRGKAGTMARDNARVRREFDR